MVQPMLVVIGKFFLASLSIDLSLQALIFFGKFQKGLSLELRWDLVPFEEKILYIKKQSMFSCSSGVSLRISDKLAEAKQNIGQNLWVLAEDAWVIADLWVMGHDFPQINLVNT